MNAVVDSDAEKAWLRSIYQSYTKRVGAWTLEVVSATSGLIPSVEFVATHADGRQERFDVSRWPAGWRILRVGLDVPESVKREARRIAKEVWAE